MFAWLEKNPFFFTIAFVVVFSVAGLVQIIPDFRKSSQPIEGLRPLTVLETAGRQVYIKEGCYNCHSQLIREFKSEVMRYGMYSLSGEYAYDRPFLWGSKELDLTYIELAIEAVATGMLITCMIQTLLCLSPLCQLISIYMIKK